MSETSDDILTRPLGMAEPKSRAERIRARLRGPLRARTVLGGGAAVLALGAGALVAFGDPQGGEPRVT
ncbi:hypothetical protein MHIMP23_12185, partial [Methylobacterium hispanicum]